MKAYTGQTRRLDESVCAQTPPEPVYEYEYQIVLTEDALRYAFETILPALIGMVGFGCAGIIFFIVLGQLR